MKSHSVDRACEISRNVLRIRMDAETIVFWLLASSLSTRRFLEDELGASEVGMV